MKRIVVLLLCLLFVLTGLPVGATDELVAMGAENSIVVRIQTRLMDLGYYTYKPSGSFGDVTRRALVAWQVNSGLMSDGSAGAETMNALFSHSAGRAEYRAIVPLAYTAQGALARVGQAMDWKVARALLKEGESYVITNCATLESCTLVYSGGRNHAEMVLPVSYAAAQASRKVLDSWLGGDSSFFKCAVLVDINSAAIAASLLWSGESCCLYFSGSGSHVLNLPDAEHELVVKKAAGQ